MNERTHLFIKICISHFILERVDVSMVCERWMERHILWERTSSHILFQDPGGANACTPLQARQGHLDRLRVPRSTVILCTLLNLTAWFSLHGLLPVTHRLDLSALIVLSCLLIKIWQPTKALGVTSNEPKIHVMLYNTSFISEILTTKRWSFNKFYWLVNFQQIYDYFMPKSQRFAFIERPLSHFRVYVSQKYFFFCSQLYDINYPSQILCYSQW